MNSIDPLEPDVYPLESEDVAFMPTIQHYPVDPIPAQSPPGIRVEPPASREIMPDMKDWDSLILEARRLFRNARHPRQDPAWPAIQDALEDWQGMLRRAQVATPEDRAFVEDRITTIRKFLGATS